MTSLDADHDGQISFEEFQSGFQVCRCECVVVWSRSQTQTHPMQHGSHLVSRTLRVILEAIRAGIGLGLGPRLVVVILLYFTAIFSDTNHKQSTSSMATARTETTHGSASSMATVIGAPHGNKDNKDGAFMHVDSAICTKASLTHSSAYSVLCLWLQLV